jgi:hypothetical protein
MDYILCIAALTTCESYRTSCATYKCGELSTLLQSIISSHSDALVLSPSALSSVSSPSTTSTSTTVSSIDPDALNAIIDLAKDTLEKLPTADASSVNEAEAGRIHFRGSS